MDTTASRTRQLELRSEAQPVAVCRGLRARQPVSLWLDGSGTFADSWHGGPLVAVTPSVIDRVSAGTPSDVVAALDRLRRVVEHRRRSGGVAETGVAALASFELLGGTADAGVPDLIVLAVDRSVRFRPAGSVLVTDRGTPEADPGQLAAVVEQANRARSPAAPSVRCQASPVTSLPREAYLRAVERVKGHIERGDIYQANLCQRFDIRCEGDPLETFARMLARTPAPRSAFLETPEVALASMSPEGFVDATADGRIETRPIKGTRPRGDSPARDRDQAATLRSSEKDRAELLMIVDLERNDLSRLCDAGTVEVTELAGLRSYAAVHHLVACVRGRVSDGVGIDDLFRATFPGGSISGAPKIRALQILQEIEPVRRGFFTGSLFWFADDGRMESSILIRSWTFAAGGGQLGAGGGIVADSDPEQEWMESNHKARALAEAVGFSPEDAG